MSHNITGIVENRNAATAACNEDPRLEKLSKKGPFAAFDQTDVTYGKSKSGEWTELLKPENKIQLIDVIKNNYVVEPKRNFEDLEDG